MPPKERKLVGSYQDNWRCPNLSFVHVEWHCFIGSEVVATRRRALDQGLVAAPGSRPPLSLDSPLTTFFQPRWTRFVTCLRHPIDRLISIYWCVQTLTS